MNVTPLGNVCQINPGADKGLSPDQCCSFVPMEAVDDKSGMITRKQTRRIAEVSKGYTPFHEEDVLFAKITPCMENGKCAVAKGLTNGIGFGSTEFHVLRSGSDILPAWIFHFLRQESVRQEAGRNMTGSGGQQRVPAAFLSELEIPLPPLPEQQRLAALLDKADHLRRTRRYAQQLSDTFLQSVFLEMFAGASSKQWPQETIEELAKQGHNTIRTGPFGSQILHSEFVDSGVAVLGIDNAVQNYFAWDKRRFITQEKYRQLKRYTVHPDDLLFTIMGTCGRCAIVPEDVPVAINTKHLCCVTLDHSKCLPSYLHAAFLMHPVILERLGLSERGAIMPGLNMGIIKDLAVPTPPLPLQEQFAQVVRRTERLRAQQREAARQAEHLFQTLLHRAFRGEA